jgi:hypothetical protein
MWGRERGPLVTRALPRLGVPVCTVRQALDRRTLSRTGARALRAVVHRQGDDPSRVILSRSLPRCGL